MLPHTVAIGMTKKCSISLARCVLYLSYLNIIGRPVSDPIVTQLCLPLK